MENLFDSPEFTKCEGEYKKTKELKDKNKVRQVEGEELKELEMALSFKVEDARDIATKYNLIEGQRQFIKIISLIKEKASQSQSSDNRRLDLNEQLTDYAYKSLKINGFDLSINKDDDYFSILW
jgi:uncharacterized protein (DUF2344 family)